MEYPYHLHGMAVDVPLFEDRSLGYFQQLVDNPAMSWSTTDPTLLVNEQPWSSRVKVPVAHNAAAGDLHVSVQSSSHQANVDQSAVQLNCVDTAATISTDPLAFPGDVPHWMQVYFLLQDQYYNDSLPNLISDSAAQQPCLYTSDSSGSSERDRNLSSNPCVAPSSSDEINWRKSDVVQRNLTASGAAGFYIEELHDDSSSVPVDADTSDVNGHPPSLVRLQRTSFDCAPMGPVSWMAHPTAESERAAMISRVVNHTSTLDQPFIGAAPNVQENGPPPYKRQRATYSLETMPTTMNQSLIPSLSRHIARSPDYPMTSLNVADALYREARFPSRQFTGLPHPAATHLVVSGLDIKGDSSSDQDSRSHRKHNTTSIEPQSVAARHRRKKISERVRVLEKLIPGGNKMDTASMLDEAIEYVKFLQLQVQLLESLGDNSEPGSSRSTPLILQLENIEGGQDGFVKRFTSFGTHPSRSCPTSTGRPTSSPLILSEVLQQQLFKQKLCLVSLRQCPPRCSSSAAYA